MARGNRKGVSLDDASWIVDFFLERAVEEAIRAERWRGICDEVASGAEAASIAHYYDARLLAQQCDRSVFDAWAEWSQWRAWMLAAARGEDTAEIAP
jgi:hypothetical protein